ncbi:MAG TPA: VanZ family protein [Pirellulales bacterium]|jgi:VanZ family protein|nr:VanZ family protein [Pirellulales bacterium]
MIYRDEELIAPPRKPSWPHRLWRYGPVLIWIGLIFWASTDQFSSENTAQVIQPWLVWLFPGMSAETLDWLHGVIRKSAHVTEYAIFALLVARAFLSSSRPWLSRRWFVAGFLVLTALAASDEYHQSFVPSRTAAVTDVLIDMSGGLVALTILALFRRWRTWRRMRRATTTAAFRA